ncbi:MAG: hypothetical protein ACWA5W_10580 [Phycisphaerales bacterium]
MREVEIRIDGEHETANGWLYTLSLRWGDGNWRDHELTMAWVDHEHLVGGTVSPSEVAGRALVLACEYFGEGQVPAKCDVSSLRRVIEDFDQRVKAG